MRPQNNRKVLFSTLHNKTLHSYKFFLWYFSYCFYIIFSSLYFLQTLSYVHSCSHSKLKAKASFSTKCCYTHTYSHFPKYIHTMCSVCIMWLICMFPGQQFGIGQPSSVTFPEEDYFSIYQGPLVSCSTLFRVRPPLFCVSFCISMSVIVHFQVMFKHSCWWYFMGIAFDFHRRHNHLKITYSSGS